ncbi:diguanylate cyclase (GGDEF) domain-containing protein [Allopseudospirillum japonicum]|uniref:diguanylate cyclase n=1 Tax=Allopseudospirillum japonicum TaxID=64971 RepID=A0A1H6T610_9GAMM|nr:diguanylate cyclase [Allopseudospirillum japonicum]SEI75458.1 diguanylate cyclase (GGDEF) domain-containing protein [Allopseudospirillum japonicum]
MQDNIEFAEIHWLLQVLQNIDIGLVVLDRQYNVQLWNGFMENHSGRTSTQVKGKNLFRQFPELNESWLRRKVDSVWNLGVQAYTTWEQKQNIFPFRSYRPLTGHAQWMYQNLTILPLTNVSASISHVCLLLHDVTEVASAQLGLQDANTQLDFLSRTDKLTGLNNRGTWETLLQQHFHQYQRTQEPVSLIMFDIDHFKRINDTYGHPAGDTVIRSLAQHLHQSVREQDVAGRYGGEEFGVILPATSQGQAVHFAESLRQSVESLVLRHEHLSLGMTISLGVCELKSSIRTVEQWLHLADQALYAAKHQGRNCVCTA